MVARLQVSDWRSAMRRKYRGSAIVMAGLLLASSACAYGVGGATEDRRAHEGWGAVHLNVTNLSGGPLEVYAIGSGTSYRVGTVHPGLAGRFVVRPGMVVNGPVEFVARSNSGPVYRSGRILLKPGAVVDFALGAHPVTSNATVRP
jgi:hypothetical protein